MVFSNGWPPATCPPPNCPPATRLPPNCPRRTPPTADDPPTTPHNHPLTSFPLSLALCPFPPPPNIHPPRSLSENQPYYHRFYLFSGIPSHISFDLSLLKHYVIAKQIWGSNCQFFFTDRKTLSSLPKSLTCVMLLSIWIFVIVGNSMESIAKLWRQFPWVGRDWSLVVGCPRDWPRVVGTGGLSL